MSIDAKRRLASAGFALLLVVSVFWPEPVLYVNDLCCNAQLGIDDLSFLGREQPRWDVAFWFVAGLFAIGLFQSSREWRGRDFASIWATVREARFREAFRPARVIVAVAVAAASVALTWRFFDSPLIAWCERIASPALDDTIRIFNRLGGGLNPALIVIFFLVAGVLYRRDEWVRYGAAMAVAGAAAGIVAQIVKFTAGRARPELWLGPFTHARISATSFPSGHTVGAFALAGVLLFASPNTALRIVAVALAAAVGLSRMLAFRHWPSDVLASALIGLLIAWITTDAVIRLTKERRAPV